MDIQVKKKLFWATLISSILMAFLLLKVDLDHFALIARRMDLRFLTASFAAFTIGNIVRTFRFIQLDHTDTKLKQWWNINAFYNFITSTLPGGAGEAATAYVLKKYSVLNMLGAFRILFIGRLMDLSALSALLFAASTGISDVTPYREAATWIAGAIFLMTSVALIPASEHFILSILQRLPGNIKIIQKICEKLNELLEITKNRRGSVFYAVTIIQSLFVVAAGIATLYLLLRSFGVDFTLVQSIYCYGIYLVFQIVPIQGIAGIGTQAAWWALALNAADYREPDAIAVGFILYGTFYIFISLMGVLSLLAWLKGRKR